ncbi:uncharacterized protein LOC115272047 isoform X2 [Suricata suricatta]|uniref:uncharacterized protein LOC115272047 isoform X2 n=1 Tax=Suricata suricatta TaxID=37032 RepID=UPI0011561A2B|nr:uncharacterized protein LOC115272047 isoform X2 [Suricata suricatta]XP_029770929.1 uncharacterized protein LOC115272047 isoform X3 [Suricata suricatta]XP_029770930.1 uncharacterized protein LOC115272047 isoform X2 [Suricata suricatta]
MIIIHFVPLPPPPAYTARKPDLLEEIPIKVSLGTTLEATISAPLRTDRHPPIKMLEEQTTFLSRHLLPRFYGPETSGASAELPTQVHVVLAACSLSKHAHWMNSGHQLAEGLALGHRSQRYVVPPSENSKSDKFLCSLPFEYLPHGLVRPGPSCLHPLTRLLPLAYQPCARQPGSLGSPVLARPADPQNPPARSPASLSPAEPAAPAARALPPISSAGTSGRQQPAGLSSDFSLAIE